MLTDRSIYPPGMFGNSYQSLNTFSEWLQWISESQHLFRVIGIATDRKSSKKLEMRVAHLTITICKNNHYCTSVFLCYHCTVWHCVPMCTTVCVILQLYCCTFALLCNHLPWQYCFGSCKILWKHCKILKILWKYCTSVLLWNRPQWQHCVGRCR